MVQRAKMTLGKDEELGKKDDEYKPKNSSIRHQWYRLFAKKRRIAAFFTTLFLIYLFIHNIPTDLKPAMKRPSYSGPQQNPYQQPQWERPRSDSLEAQSPSSPAAPPKPLAGAGQITDAAVHYYEGPIKFYYLATSLHSLSKIGGRNILFAASDLQSAAAIIPLACEMSRWKRNFVHMAFFGREEISVEDLKSINGVDKETCDVSWHDARPDYASFSSGKRMEISVAGALSHINTFMHPQILITADSAGEDDFFARPARTRAKELNIPVIEIPLEGAERLAWMTRLDAAALHNWHSSGIDIVIQAPSDSSGSILRLLKSLEHADYAGFNPPRLTIELPTTMDVETEAFINSFQWPPLEYQHHAHRNELILHRRIPQRSIDEEEAAIRFIESFYPASLTGPHILLLSPQAELSPAFFHYLKYYLLEYKYTTIGGDTDNLMGISLEAPSVYLNGSTSFVVPVDPLAGKDDISPFLWQAPNSNAVLYFADKWMEVHSFLTHRHNSLQRSLTKEQHKDRTKYVSRTFPAWVEYFLDLMKSRAYTVQYPGHSRSPSYAEYSLVIIHNELYQPPEEYTHKPTTLTISNDPLPTASILTASTDYHTKYNEDQAQLNNVELPLLQSLLTLFPPSSFSQADKPEGSLVTTLQPPPVQALSSLLRLDYEGDTITQKNISVRAAAAADQYRRLVGGCSEAQAERNEDNVTVGRADDLFCLGDLDLDGDDSETPRSEATSTSTSITSVTTAPAVTTTRVFGGDGAASTVERVVNPARYQETALAGFRNKIQGLKKTSPDAESAKSGTTTTTTTEKDLTPMEEKELEDWQAEVRKTDSGAVQEQEPQTKPPRGKSGNLGRISMLTDEDPEPGSPRTRPLRLKEEPDLESIKLPVIPAGNADPDGDGRVHVEDLNVQIKPDGSASLLDTDGDEELVKLHAEVYEELKPTETDYIHGSDGAAATIARVVDPAGYEATARAGFKNKMKDRKKGDQTP